MTSCNCPKKHRTYEFGNIYWCNQCNERFVDDGSTPTPTIVVPPPPSVAPTTPKPIPAAPAKPTQPTPKRVSFAITGVLPSGRSKATFAEEMERHGHSWSKSFSNGTRVLICEENRVNSKSKKERKAESMGIPIVTEKEFIENYCE